MRKRSPSESDINFADSFEIPRNEISCIKIQDTGYHDCSTGREYLIHLEHDYLQAESRLSRPVLISALEDALKNGQRTPSGSATPEKMYELQRTVVLDWDLNSVEQLLDQLNKHNPEETIVDEDPLFYLLGKLIQHQRDLKTSKSDISYNSLEITSIVGRGHKLVLNDAIDTAEEEPLLVLHMGRERAMNIIPKKLNLAMLDVFDVQLGNFSLISISHKTKDSMHISLPKEKALEEDDLDLHILVKPILKRVSKEILDGEELSSTGHPVPDGKPNDAEKLIASEEPDVFLEQRDISTMNQHAVAEEHNVGEEPDVVIEKLGAEEQSAIISEERDHDTTMNQHAVAEEHNVGEEPDGAKEKLTSEERDHDTTMNQHAVAEEHNVGEEPDGAEEKLTSEERDHDATMNQHAVAEEHNVGEEPDGAKEKLTSEERDHDATMNQNAVAEEHNVGEEPDGTEEKLTSEERDHDATMMPPPAQNCVQPIRKSSKNKQKHDNVEGRFISTKICVSLLNSHRKETITTWLKDCGIPVPKKKKLKAHKLREQLLKHIQSIHDGNTKPTMFFVSSFLAKLPFSELLEEAKRLRIYFPKKAHETEVRRSINEYLTSEEVSETEQPLLMQSDDELSPSEPETEDDSLPDEAYRPQKTTTKKNIDCDKVKKENRKQTKHAYEKQADSGLSAKNSDKPERSQKQHTACAGHIMKTMPGEEEAVPQHHQKPDEKLPHSPYEKPILTLEQSLIEVQDRLSAQELLIESISNRSTLEQQTSTLKSLQTKNRTFFDTLNSQQCSIDTLKDSLADNTKESKKRLKKLNQLQCTVMNNAKQGQEALTELKQDVHDWMKACEVMFTELRQQIEPLTKTTTQLQSDVKKLKQELGVLKSNGYTNSEHSTNSKEEGYDNKAPHSISTDTALIAEISKLREDNKSHFARLDNRLNGLVLNNQGNSNNSKTSNTITSTIVKPKPNGNLKTHQTGQMNQKTPHRPEETRKDSSPTNRFRPEQNIQEYPSKQMSNPKKNDNHRNDASETAEQTLKPSNSKAETGKSTTSRYTTRKCLIIHDPYFRDFDESKFSRWFDIFTIGFESLKHVVSSKTLPSKVKAANPEVIFLHVGQADLLDKESGDKVLQEFKKLIKNILTHTTAKLCVSQLIPTRIIPQVDSVIKQVNKELSNHISKLRTEDAELRQRVFTCNNDSLGSCITQSVGKYGIELSLNERGQRNLWLHLRDGLNRSLGLHHPKRKISDSNNRKTSKTPHRSRSQNE